MEGIKKRRSVSRTRAVATTPTKTKTTTTGNSRSPTPTKAKAKRSPSPSVKKTTPVSKPRSRSSTPKKVTTTTPTTTTPTPTVTSVTTSTSSHQYTWQQVAQHNTQDDLWVIIHDKVYDITSWVDRHPGGVEMLRLCGGRDCTVMFDSYHILSDKHELLLPKYLIGALVEGSYEFPPYMDDTGMYIYVWCVYII